MNFGQKVEFRDFSSGPIEDLLETRPPTFIDRETAFRQLRSIERHLRSLDCRSIVIENHYIDRDFIEDYSVFYSRNLFPYPNSCRRLHFFSLSASKVRRRIRKLSRQTNVKKYHQAATRLSADGYLGFCVIKPLSGSPVGRTVLRPPSSSDDGLDLRFRSSRSYRVHLLGVELSVQGLAFQQQDVGVSACATTALWSSLQKMRDFEDLGSATPARITALAATASSPHGRSMPSEGLTLDQMCKVVQALEISPNVIRAEDFETSRFCLYASTEAGFAPILIIENLDNLAEVHAVTVVGTKARTDELIPEFEDSICDEASGLMSVYMHDDRVGPYVEGKVKTDGKKLELNISYEGRAENWRLTHLLVPTHQKIRLSFGSLREIGLKVVAAVNKIRDRYVDNEILPPSVEDTQTVFNVSVKRTHSYLDDLRFQRSQGETARRLALQVPLSRYVGVVSIRTPFMQGLDVLVDTTSTLRNSHLLAVVCSPGDQIGKQLGASLAEEFDCALIS